eukprot:4326002-Prorocentrum_lima.AAC.1
MVYHTQVVQAWVSFLHSSLLPYDRLQEMLQLAGHRLAQTSRPWALVSSPLEVLLLTCGQLGWQMLSPTKVQLRGGLVV